MLTPADVDPSLDAVIAAPDFHRVLFENDEIRTLEVVVPAGSREPFHTHQWPSIFVVFGSPHLRYFTPDSEEHLFEIESQTETGVLHLAPEGMHSLENIDDRNLYAFRVEMKHAPASTRAPVRGPVLEIGTPGDLLFLENDMVKVCRGAFYTIGVQCPCLQLRRSEPAPMANWVGNGTPESCDADDIIVTIKYGSKSILE